MSPRFHITTYGCQMNKNDSERIAGLLQGLGFVATEKEEMADLILVNTCSVRQSAEDRVYGSQEKYLEYKKANPKLIVAVTGCLPGRDKKGEFRKRLPATDLYFPTPDMVHLPKWIAELRPELVNSEEIERDYLKIHPLRVPSAQAYLTIQTGCNKFCTYCVVPYARGLERNRPAKEVLDEARGLLARGVIEITLLGQTVNSYRASDPETFSPENPYADHFAALLWELNRLPGLERLHWTAAHPLSMTDEVIDALALPKQVRYLHLPVQAGNDEVLRRMNRKYSREHYLELIEKIKARCPDLALGSDIIVGFSGETAEHFQETLSLYEAVGFDISYNAQYSQRSGTLAAKLFPDDVPAAEKRRRWDELQALMETISLRKNEACVGKEVRVLVEQVGHGFASGNAESMKLCRFASKDATLVGTIVPMRVVSAKAWVLEGEAIPA